LTDASGVVDMDTLNGNALFVGSLSIFNTPVSILFWLICILTSDGRYYSVCCCL